MFELCQDPRLSCQAAFAFTRQMLGSEQSSEELGKQLVMKQLTKQGCNRSKEHTGTRQLGGGQRPSQRGGGGVQPARVMCIACMSRLGSSQQAAFASVHVSGAREQAEDGGLDALGQRQWRLACET